MPVAILYTESRRGLYRTCVCVSETKNEKSIDLDDSFGKWWNIDVFGGKKSQDGIGVKRERIVYAMSVPNGPILHASWDYLGDIPWGWWFCASLAQIFLCFFSGFHPPDKRNVQAGFFVQIFGAQIFAPIFCADFLCADFLRPFLRRFLVSRFLRPFLRRFSADFSSRFWRLKNRCSRVTQKCAENAQKNLRRPNGPARGGTPHSLSAFSSRQHVTQSSLGRHTQGEHVSVHRDIFGLKGMLAFAPRFFKSRNLRKMSSAKPQPQYPPSRLL